MTEKQFNPEQIASQLAEFFKQFEQDQQDYYKKMSFTNDEETQKLTDLMIGSPVRGAVFRESLEEEQKSGMLAFNHLFKSAQAELAKGNFKKMVELFRLAKNYHEHSRGMMQLAFEGKPLPKDDASIALRKKMFALDYNFSWISEDTLGAWETKLKELGLLK